MVGNPQHRCRATTPPRSCCVVCTIAAIETLSHVKEPSGCRLGDSYQMYRRCWSQLKCQVAASEVPDTFLQLQPPLALSPEVGDIPGERFLPAGNARKFESKFLKLSESVEACQTIGCVSQSWYKSQVQLTTVRGTWKIEETALVGLLSPSRAQMGHL